MPRASRIGSWRLEVGNLELLSRRAPGRLRASVHERAVDLIALNAARDRAVSRLECEIRAAQRSGHWRRLAAGGQRSRQHLELLLQLEHVGADLATCRRSSPARCTASPCTTARSRRSSPSRRPVQSWMLNVLETMREPGRRSRNLSRRRSRLLGSRNSAMTLALEMSATNMSPWTNCALSATPASFASCLRQLDHVRVVLDTECDRAALGRADDVAAVAGAQVDDEVLRCHLCEVEHPFDRRPAVSAPTRRPCPLVRPQA